MVSDTDRLLHRTLAVYFMYIFYGLTVDKVISEYFKYKTSQGFGLDIPWQFLTSKLRLNNVVYVLNMVLYCHYL